MNHFVIYDIEDDKLRTKIFETCKDYGLRHAQYSMFFGELNHNRREEIFLKFKKIIGRKAARLVIVPVCDKDFRLVKSLNTYDESGEEDA
ncbi:CRISPR-associated endonuclease Cas2 [Sporolituus thermophilus]|uniref:CRISPR-associated endoribonuclease Cas2 n=1 Tax=Sporolituus thermophilus DSM 23256 TaxID=1123285 RepID=A0A1G7P398_9FIRM|nr:CRISPR-associated endonuclease Cas2 [Sporolituus thermophilus]SDF80765.1 CRISPR-associated protein, Cas2 family [Sporolituus thermophilus DSM 23256]